MNDLIIVGAGKTAELAYEYLKRHYYIKCFADDLFEGTKFGKEVISIDSIPLASKVFVAIGVSKLNTTRQKIYEILLTRGMEFVSYIDSRATVRSTAKIGKNCFVMEENVIQDYVTIGDNNILWSGNHIGHHTNIGDHNFISSHVVISGNCKIGNNNFFGVNSCIGDEVSVGNYNWFSPLTSSVGDIGDEKLLVLPKEARPVVAKSSTKRYFKVEMD